MAEQRQKGKSPALMVITGLVMVLLFCGFVFFLVSQGQSIPNVEEVKAQGRLKNLADLNSENQKVLAVLVQPARSPIHDFASQPPSS